MLRKRAYDALRTDVLCVDAGDLLEAVADRLEKHLEKSPDMDAVVVTRQGRYMVRKTLARKRTPSGWR